MNEELQQKLLQYLNGLETFASKGGDFVVAQAPDIAMEIVKYAVLSNTAAMTAGVALCAISWIALSRFTPLECEFRMGCKLFVGIISGIVGACVLTAGTTGIIKPLFTPKLFLLEYIANLVK